MTNTGLLSSHIPPLPEGISSARAAVIQASPQAFNNVAKTLKLGLPPMGEKLKEEVRKILKADKATRAMEVDLDEKDAVVVDDAGKPLVVPKDDDLLPMPVNFRTFDVQREVAKIVDSKKRLRLGPTTAGLTSTVPEPQWEAGVEGRVVLPSICAYSFEDNGEGITCAEFSKDSSLLAAGSEESVVRLWSLKGEKLKGMRSDFDPVNIRDCAYRPSLIHHLLKALGLITFSLSPSLLPQKDTRKVWLVDAQTHRAFRPRLRSLLLSIDRLFRSSSPSPLVLR